MTHDTRLALIDKDGDERFPAVLKFSGKAREAQAYRLDPAIAARLGIPAQASR